jgi:plastocyanin
MPEHAVPAPQKRTKLLAILVVIVLIAGALSVAVFIILSAPPAPRHTGPPSASFNVTQTLMRVDVDAGSSSDPDGDISSYRWDWQDDGTFDETNPSPTATHTYPSPGMYTIRLQVADAQGNVSNATRKVSVARSTLDYVFDRFFEGPLGEWRDYRSAPYNEHPVGAECLNASSITNGVCTPSLSNVPDVASYPYTVWGPFPFAGRLDYTDPNNDPMINAPYRMRVTGVNVTGYSRSEPVFLPVLDYAQPSGGRLDFDWRAQFLDTPLAARRSSEGCPAGAVDGYMMWSDLVLTMDLPQSRRIFGVDGANAAQAQAWWDANIDPTCTGQGPVESALFQWFARVDSTKYDIWNAYEWYLDQRYVRMVAIVDPDGTTHVTIGHLAWGTMNLLARMFYWGNESYLVNYLDSRLAAGWLGMEPYSWFESFAFAGSLGPDTFDFSLNAVIPYHFRHLSLPGPDGYLNRVGDIPVWAWGPMLHDYLNDYGGNLESELDRYPGAGDLHGTPGGVAYNRSLPRYWVPSRWDLREGETWHFQFPTGNIVYFDPNLSPIPSNPVSNDHVKVSAPIKLYNTRPTGFGDWDPLAKTLDVFGPLETGAPSGNPGSDGIPGTFDDEYVDEPWPAIYLAPVSAATYTLSADLDGWAGRDGTRNPTLTVGAGDTVTVSIDWVNSLHNWALYPAGTPPEQVAHGSPSAIVRTSDVSTSSRKATLTFSLAQPETYEYYCEYHAFLMHGQIMVLASSSGSLSTVLGQA